MNPTRLLALGGFAIALSTLSHPAALLAEEEVELPGPGLESAAETLLPVLEAGLCLAEYRLSENEAVPHRAGLQRVDGRAAWPHLRQFLADVYEGDLDCQSEPLTCALWGGHGHTLYRFVADEGGSARLAGILLGSGHLAGRAAQEQARVTRAFEACLADETRPGDREGDGLRPPHRAYALSASLWPGATWRYRVTEGDEVSVMTVEVVSVSEEGATIETRASDSSGGPLGEPERVTSTWDALESRAHFSADATQAWRTNVAIGDVAGPAWVFVVQESDDTTVESTFPLALPGPPARMTRSVGGQVEIEVTLETFEPGQPGQDDAE